MNSTAPDSTINCKNCETPFVGNFCPNCGQSVKDYEKPFGLLIYDLMGNIFAFDTRLWKTLKAVLFQPGKMSQEFILGRRVRYMPPFRFYVFVSFIFFLFLNFSASKNWKASESNEKMISVGITQNLQAEKVSKESEPIVVTSKDEVDKIDGLNDESKEKVKDILAHPKLFFSEFLKYLSWILFFLMPLYGSFLWLFFRKSYNYYLGHLIFAINQHSFLFIVFTIMVLIKSVFPAVGDFINGWLFLLVPIYSIIGARRLYHKKWMTVFWRLFAIFFIYSIIVIGGVVLAAVIVFV